MSQHNYALLLEELQDENDFLYEQIEELEERLSHYEGEENKSSTHSKAGRGEWSDWPYCWIIAGWNKTTERFHSFHGRLCGAVLSQRNLRLRRKFWRRAQHNDFRL